MISKSLLIILCVSLGFFLGKSQTPEPIDLSESPSSKQVYEKKVAPKPVLKIKNFADAESILIKAKQENRAYKPEKMKRFSKARIESRFKRLRRLGATQTESINAEF
jgi:hypothetical protein